MEYVYIVQSSYGQYDESYDYMNGVFRTQEAAETLRENVISKINALCQEPEPQLEDYKTEEEYSDRWCAWHTEHGHAFDFNHCYVIKTPLDAEFDLNIKPEYI